MTGLVTSIALPAIAEKVVGNAKHDWNAIPPKVKLILLGLVIAFAGFLLHQHYAHKALAAAEQRGEAKAYANVARQARELADKANALNRSLAAKIRSKTDEALVDNARAADALRLRGPGAARCTAIAGVPVAARGSRPTDRAGDASVAGLRDEERADLIALPAAPTFDFGEQHDNFRTEALAWRSWWTTFNARWQKWQADAANARQGS